MSILGPRPLLPSYLPWYTEREKHRHDVRPGLSGLAQVNGRNYLDWDKRFELDVQYTEKITFLGDLNIIFQTCVILSLHVNILLIQGFQRREHIRQVLPWLRFFA